jgi:hypothetical protein
MVDAIGMYAGIRPFKNASEYSFSDMMPPMNQFENIKNNPVRNIEGYFSPPQKTPREFNDTIFRSTLKQVLPLKGDMESVKYSRPSTDLNGGMYVNQGYARHQPMGLATDVNKPMDRPILPISGFYNIDMVNTLGNLK